MVRREMRLDSAQRGSSRAALAECILAERRREGTCRPHTNAARAGSHAGSQAGSQLVSEAATMEGTARLNRLAQPRTQLWEKCAAASLTWQLQIAWHVDLPLGSCFTAVLKAPCALSFLGEERSECADLGMSAEQPCVHLLTEASACGVQAHRRRCRSSLGHWLSARLHPRQAEDRCRAPGQLPHDCLRLSGCTPTIAPNTSRYKHPAGCHVANLSKASQNTIIRHLCVPGMPPAYLNSAEAQEVQRYSLRVLRCAVGPAEG